MDVRRQEGTEDRLEDQAKGVRQSAAHLESSASAVRRSTHHVAASADRTTQLAADRTVLAAERTYAAWVRTGLAALASGVGARALLGDLLPVWFASLTGSVLILFSMFCFVAGVWRQLRPGAPPPEPDTPQLPSALLVAVNGFLVLVGIAALTALWLARAPL
jgi:putative membrane protein